MDLNDLSSASVSALFLPSKVAWRTSHSQSQDELRVSHPSSDQLPRCWRPRPRAFDFRVLLFFLHITFPFVTLGGDSATDPPSSGSHLPPSEPGVQFCVSKCRAQINQTKGDDTQHEPCDGTCRSSARMTGGGWLYTTPASMTQPQRSTKQTEARLQWG